MPKKTSNSRDLKVLPSFSEDQDLDGFDGGEPERSMKSARSMGSRSSGGGSRKSRDKDKKQTNSRSSKQDSKIGSSTIEKVGADNE